MEALALCLKQQEETRATYESILASVTEEDVWLALAGEWQSAAIHSLELRAIALEEGATDTDPIPEVEYLLALDSWKQHLLPCDLIDVFDLGFNPEQLTEFYKAIIEFVYLEPEIWLPTAYPYGCSRIDNVVLNLHLHYEFPLNLVHRLPSSFHKSPYTKEIVRQWLAKRAL
jgi:hypothetical protein